MAEKRNRLALKPRIRLPSIRPEIQTERRTTQRTITTTKLPETTTRFSKQTEGTEFPINAFTIDIKELAGINKYLKQGQQVQQVKQDDGPMRISMNIFTTPKPEMTSTEEDDQENVINITPDFSLTGFTQPPNAKDEIMEILKDADRRARLAQVLASRNMTFGELVALRERGSSQLHLADIFHNQSKEPNAAEGDVIVAKRPVVPAFETDFPPRPALAINPSDSNYFTSLIDMLPPKSNVRESRVNHNFQHQSNNPIHTSIMDVLNQQKQIENQVNQVHQVPNWKSSVYRSIDGVGTSLLSDDTLEPIDDNNIPPNLNSIPLQHQNIEIDEDEYMQLPSGVRSAIVASTAVIASSIVIFMTIFIIFKWHLKRRKQLRYNGSFNTIRGRLPILQQSIRQSQRSKRELSPVMVNVTKSSKNLLLNGNSTSKLNNISSSSSECSEEQNQYLWDSLRKSFR